MATARKRRKTSSQPSNNLQLDRKYESILNLKRRIEQLEQLISNLIVRQQLLTAQNTAMHRELDVLKKRPPIRAEEVAGFMVQYLRPEIVEVVCRDLAYSEHDRLPNAFYTSDGDMSPALAGQLAARLVMAIKYDDELAHRIAQQILAGREGHKLRHILETAAGEISSIPADRLRIAPAANQELAG